MYVKTVKAPKYANITNVEIIAKNAVDLKYVYMTNKRYTVKNAQILLK